MAATSDDGVHTFAAAEAPYRFVFSVATGRVGHIARLPVQLSGTVAVLCGEQLKPTLWSKVCISPDTPCAHCSAAESVSLTFLPAVEEPKP
jgi:hypothetical protein